MNESHMAECISTSIDEEELWDKSGRYQRYWTHHQQVSTWMKKYIKGYTRSEYHGNQTSTMPPHMLYYGYYGNPYQLMYNQWMMQHQYHSGRHGYPSHVNHSHWRQSESHVMDDAEDPDTMNFDINDSHSDDSFEMEISEELRNFFAVSAKFKEERRKNQETQDLEEDNSAHTGSKLKRSTAPPTERPGQRRLKEMQELYGKHAAMIHGMETALQLQFDRVCDQKQPSHWPIIPLNV